MTVDINLYCYQLFLFLIRVSIDVSSTSPRLLSDLWGARSEVAFPKSSFVPTPCQMDLRMWQSYIVSGMWITSVARFWSQWKCLPIFIFLLSLSLEYISSLSHICFHLFLGGSVRLLFLFMHIVTLCEDFQMSEKGHCDLGSQGLTG